MYLHLGLDTVVQTKNIIGIFDIDNTTVSKITRETLKKAEQNGEAVTIGYDLPKSYIVCAEKEKKNMIYISPVTPVTLTKRIQKKNGAASD